MKLVRVYLTAALAIMTLGTPGCGSDPEHASAAGARESDVAAVEADSLLGTDRDAFFDELVSKIAGVQVVSELGLRRLDLRWKDALENPRRRFQSAKTAQDVYYALRSLQRSFHDIHSRFQLNEGALVRPTDPPVKLPLTFRAEFPQGSAGSATYVVSALESGIDATIGSTLVSIDGMSMADAERLVVEWEDGNSPEALRQSVARWLTRRVAAKFPSPAIGSTSRLDLVHPTTGETYFVDVEWASNEGENTSDDPCLAGFDGYPASPDYRARHPEFVGINYCIYGTDNPTTKLVRWFDFFYVFREFFGNDPSVGSMQALRRRMSAMSYPIPGDILPAAPGESLPDEEIGWASLSLSFLDLDQMLSHLTAQNVERLFIDLRENGGGNLDPGWIAPFARAPFRQLATQAIYGPGLKANPDLFDAAEGVSQIPEFKAHLLANPTAERSPVTPFLCLTERCDESEMIVEGAEHPVAAEVVLLTGPDCVSSCDNFVTMMRDNDLATLVGMPTRGGDSPVRVPVTFTLKDGTTTFTLVLTVAVNLRANGEVLEGNPPFVDIPVYPSAGNRDAYLEALLAAAHR